MRSMRALFWILAVLAFLYALIFPLLTIDSLALLFKRADTFERGNLMLILFLEISRLFATLVGIGVAAYLLLTASNRAGGRALALFLLFATITYEKVFGGGVIGPVQETTARALIGGGVPPALLKFLFSEQIWTVWPALAALLRFSVVFPRELQPDVLEASGEQDRQGLLRGNAVAGADIGASFRAMSRRLLERNAFAPLPLTLFAMAAIVVHVTVAERMHFLAFWVLALLLMFIAVTNVRGAYLASDEEGRARTSWITLGLVLGLFIFLFSTAAYVLIALPAVRAAAFGLMMLMPAVIMTCLALSVVLPARYDRRAAVHGAVRGGAIAVAMMLVLAAILAVGGLVSERFGVPTGLTALAAVLLAAVAYVPVSKATDSMRRKVLEQATADERI